jgi:hypothetical protein
MRRTMGIALAFALVGFAAAHVALVLGLAKRTTRLRVAAALVVAPLAPWWGYRAGMRARVLAWGACLALYALGVGIAAR